MLRVFDYFIDILDSWIRLIFRKKTISERILDIIEYNVIPLLISIVSIIAIIGLVIILI